MRKCFLALALVLGIGGCAAPGTHPYSSMNPDARDPRRADELNTQAADLMGSNPQEAERLLRAALGCDLFHGPAHNNLGVIYLEQGQWYQAASEFEWARKLLPGHPDPRVNLALTLEKADRLTDAIASYESALEVRPGHLPAIQGLARARVKSGLRDDRTKELLDEIVMRGSDEWREWAQGEKTRME